MTFGLVPPPATDSVSRMSRTLELAEWTSAGIPLLGHPREVVTTLYTLHLPVFSTAVVAVLGPGERLTASASFTVQDVQPDGWECRNALLRRLRRVLPHDLRRRSPVHTAVLLHCREGEAHWTEADGAWMWGLRDACTLHGLRCGAFVVLTRWGWQVLGERRGGRRPGAGPAQGVPDTTAPPPENGPPVQLPVQDRTPPRPEAGTVQELRRSAAG